MPDAARKALAEVLGWRTRPNPIDLYNAIRDALIEARPPARDGQGR
jgi:hypothetical protein